MKKGVDYIGVGCGAIIFDHDGLALLTKRGPLAKEHRIMRANAELDMNNI